MRENMRSSLKFRANIIERGMLMQKDTKLPTWREAWRLNRRAFILIYKRCPRMILSRLICIVWDALTPYAGIYLSALLITELTEARDPAVLTKLVLSILFSAALISLIAAFSAQMARHRMCRALL